MCLVCNICYKFVNTYLFIVSKRVGTLWLLKTHLFAGVCGTYPLSSNRQHLSYDGCLEVRGEIIRTILCCIVY